MLPNDEIFQCLELQEQSGILWIIDKKNAANNASLEFEV